MADNRVTQTIAYVGVNDHLTAQGCLAERRRLGR